ncbi:hypothetical protein GCM10018980_52060 [Streptomyces capoamus]|uniref:Uncharacterized protein n=1 Tax=Streptomyces capoamus TaxID=68183 RepID=A0A919KE49_9ACTN|nr:hypothetical protein [Streptomyces capoamus]GGW15720.1 hypothetical protein GCM10010501_28760 [Streptomyces libani subsp. rufus]GHG62254.1 hypothetical protein GCM10018980_52060 [Streptomyces capoamus]
MSEQHCGAHDGPCFPDPSARCAAHGEQQCARCHRTPSTCAGDSGECRIWSSTGMHWHTCPNRVRGPLTVSPCPRPECGGDTHTDGWGQPTRCSAAQDASLRLTAEELVPVLFALERRRLGQLAGHGILRYPLPNCPSCGAPPTEMTTASGPDLLTDTVAIRFERCGHAFTADGQDIQEAGEQARLMAEEAVRRPMDVASREPDDGTQPEAPPAATPLEEAQATIESLRYQIRRAREALTTDEPGESADLQAAIARVRALHREEYGSCAHCTREDGVPYPCPTIRALNGDTPHSKESKA